MNDLLNEWVERLGLQAWRIKLKTDVAEEDIPGENIAGHVKYDEELSAAVIYVISEKDYPKDSILEYDAERTLVHELLHIKFSLWDDSRYRDPDFMPDRYMHQLVDDMARALVCAKRGTLKIGIKEEL
jgi:hypothetical protein